MRQTNEATELPLARTLAEMREEIPLLRAYWQVPCVDGWVGPADWLSEASLAPICNEIARRYGTPSATVVGQVILAGYQWGLLMTALACYVRDGRVPTLAPDSVWLHWNGEHRYVDAVAYNDHRFACLPQDRQSDHPHAMVLPDETALRRYLRLQIEEHFSMVIDRICAHLGMRPPALWLTLADRCAAALLWLNEQAGERCYSPCRLQREVQALLGAAQSPLCNKRTGILLVETGEGTAEPVLRRVACCQAYRLAGHEYCSTCPHLPSEERLSRIDGDGRSRLSRVEA